MDWLYMPVWVDQQNSGPITRMTEEQANSYRPSGPRAGGRTLIDTPTLLILSLDGGMLFQIFVREDVWKEMGPPVLTL